MEGERGCDPRQRDGRVAVLDAVMPVAVRFVEALVLIVALLAAATLASVAIIRRVVDQKERRRK